MTWQGKRRKQLPGDLDCPDCGTRPGGPHEDGCDVARCTICGWQRITCYHAESDEGWGQIWTGRWPSDRRADAI